MFWSDCGMGAIGFIPPWHSQVDKAILLSVGERSERNALCLYLRSPSRPLRGPRTGVGGAAHVGFHHGLDTEPRNWSFCFFSFFYFILFFVFVFDFLLFLLFLNVKWWWRFKIAHAWLPGMRDGGSGWGKELRKMIRVPERVDGNPAVEEMWERKCWCHIDSLMTLEGIWKLIQRSATGRFFLRDCFCSELRTKFKCMLLFFGLLFTISELGIFHSLCRRE